ncbi:class I adenylate-forming enzyme family protein [Cryptosporangium minutisporangium]|uniref:class I adenylate-forming enzyme family protein n=1 Tax=Cryptosporangium minutisporangium TaxID=113569 RepID=UPI0035EF22E7
MNIVSLLDIVASVEPDRVALGDRRSGLTYGQLRERVGVAAAALAGQPERPVLYAGTATIAFPVALFAAAVAGRPFAPISYRLAKAPFEALVADQAPALLIADERTLRDAALADGVDVIETAAYAAAVPDLAPVEPEHDPEAPAVLLHTSGTTGKPKVAILRHRHLTSYVLGGTELLSAGADEAALVSVPPYHIAGVAGLLTGLYSGRRIVQLPNFDPDAWVALAAEQQVTHAMLVPTMLARIIDVLERDGTALPALRHLSYGGGRMPLPVIEKALELLPHVNFVNGYGLTETTSSIAVLGPDEHREARSSTDPSVRRRLGSVGRPLPSVEIVVRDPVGTDLPAGERGELWVRGPQVSGEYASGSRIDADGWFRTRDAGWIDDDGYVYVEGRLDDVIVRGGENLSPGEIEDVIAAHPDVDEAVVFGVPDDQWGEVAVAAVVPRPGVALDEGTVQRWVAERLRSTRVPERVLIRAELPRNEMGKLLRRVLRAEATPPAVVS